MKIVDDPAVLITVKQKDNYADMSRRYGFSIDLGKWSIGFFTICKVKENWRFYLFDVQTRI